MLKLWLVGLAAFVCLSLPLSGTGQANQHRTYVLVHGAWGGGWSFREVERLLRAEGHEVRRATLTGQGERVHLAGPNVGLQTHINDVVNLILYEDLDSIILVGHSYGGVVITGVADSLPGRIRKLIYLDAILPENGESVFQLQGRPDPEAMARMVKDGGWVPIWTPADKKPPKDVPHPVKTFSDPIELRNEDRKHIPASYILTVDEGKKPEEDDFFRHAERAKRYGWPVVILTADHNPQWSAPVPLVRMLIAESR